MGSQLFPNEIIKNSSEVNFAQHSIQTKIIYSSTVLFLLTALTSLAFIKTDVSVHSRGIIQPITDRNKLTSVVGGKIQQLLINRHSRVRRGQIIAQIAAPYLREKLQHNVQQQLEIKRYLSDLVKLQKIDSSVVFDDYDLKSPKYSRSLLKFRQQVQNLLQKVQWAEQKYNRNKDLYERDYLSDVKYEQTFFNLQSARNDLKLLFKEQLSRWQTEEVNYRDELNQLQTNKRELSEKLQQYTLRAPVSGTIQNMKGVYEGSYITPNQILAEISPDTGLIAECYIPPKDIGLIREGMEARFQVSAFDFNQWGFLNGDVIAISEDVTVVNNRPVFTVRSRLDQTYLELKNGYRGYLKKGMTIQARFIIDNRSLFQLLYENVNDWLNPNWGRSRTQQKQASL